MNVKQSYFDFLAAQGAKEKVQAIIEHDINACQKERSRAAVLMWSLLCL